MTNNITNRQMVFIIFLFLTSYSTIDLPKIMAEKAGRSGWILIMAASIIFGVAAMFIVKLNNLFPGKIFIEYCPEITGKFVSFLITMVYFLYAIAIGIFLSLKMAITVQSNFLPKTPQAAILLVGITLFSYVAYKGITNVARMLEIIGVLFLLVTVGICVIILAQGMTYNILPFFNASELKTFLAAMKDLCTPFTGLGILFVIPFTEQNKNAPKVAFLTLFCIGNGKPFFDVKTYYNAELLYGDKLTPYNLKEDDVRKISETLAGMLKKELTEAISRAQTELECDYFQFDDEFRIKYPDEFAKMDWKKEFTRADVNVDAKVDMITYSTIDYTFGEVR